MTEQELEALREMSTPAIRRAQGIVQLQLPLAHAQRNTRALAKLQELERDYAEELCRRFDLAEART
jgi:hypothetical protein